MAEWKEQPAGSELPVRSPDEILEIAENADARNRLSESCVEYQICVIDAESEPRKALSSLETLRKAAVELAANSTQDYIWQRESFELEVKRHDGLLYLQGTTDHGDCVEDEWLIVFILVQISKRFSNIWIRVSDNDGEFLLIEAASAVPKWLSPENDAYRPWVHQGNLFIIPTIADGDGKDQQIKSLSAALDAIKSAPDSLVHLPLVEAEAFYRLEKYPAQIKDSSHCALATIPRKLAYILHERPSAIAPVVEAVYFRDPITMKPLPRSPTSLVCPPEDLVTVSVRFTKMLFAQLRSQRLTAPPVWQAAFSAIEAQAESSPEARKRLDRLDIGMKMACGFEMVAATADKSNSRVVREVAIILSDLDEDGDESLPTDTDIKEWADADREDDDSWLDIDFADFERELAGKQDKHKESKKPFGDAAAQADLRKIVERFEAFLNNDEAGLEGAEVEAMDKDDNSDLDSEDDSDDEDDDGVISFDEDEFSEMMREMMGLPGNGKDKGKGPAPAGQSTKVTSKAQEEQDEEDIRGLSAQMEAELNALGALKLDSGATPKQSTIKASKQKAQSANQTTDQSTSSDEEEGDEEVDLDYNLAKNLLESFKGQAGMAGPASNILGMLGMALPRDDGDDEDSPEARHTNNNKEL